MPPFREKRETGPGSRRLRSNEQKTGLHVVVFEVAIVNASLSKDEFAVLAHLRGSNSVSMMRTTARIEADLRDMIRQKDGR